MEREREQDGLDRGTARQLEQHALCTNVVWCSESFRLYSPSSAAGVMQRTQPHRGGCRTCTQPLGCLKVTMHGAVSNARKSAHNHGNVGHPIRPATTLDAVRRESSQGGVGEGGHLIRPATTLDAMYAVRFVPSRESSQGGDGEGGTAKRSGETHGGLLGQRT